MVAELFKRNRGTRDVEPLGPVEYIEPVASTSEWLKEHVVPTRSGTVSYVKSLFPFLTWIYRYNWVWFVGDLIAGVTVGIVVIPQGMAYAKLASLPPEFGLYSSFVGVAIYWLSATSHVISAGPVAVFSSLLSVILEHALPQLPEYADTPWIIAGCLSVVLGCIVMAIGLFRIGFIVNFIPLPAIAAFMTGSALNIAMGQIPTLMGNNTADGYNTRAATYLVFGNFFKYIKHCDLNAAIGLTALFMLYAVRWGCGYASRRWPQHEKTFFFINTLRSGFVILLYTLISFLVNRNHHDDPKFSILKTIPRGFQHMGVPVVNSRILSAVAAKLPSAIIVLVIEHISIAKSFARLSNYTIDPNQELIAIGLTNIFGPFFGGYPATGSFSRTAIKAKAGVRTPLAGVVTAIIVVIAIYALPPVFYYISNAALAAVIIHAVGDLISSPKSIKMFWKVSPCEFVIFWIGVLVSVFASIDNGIYASVAASAALLLFRIAKAHGRFVGVVKVYNTPTLRPVDANEQDSDTRNVFVPLDRSNGVNPAVQPREPHAGVFIYRLNEGYLYPNAVHFTDHMVREIKVKTRPAVINPYGSLGERPWNDPGPRHKSESDIDPTLPVLRAIILDFSGVSNVDVTSLQNLIDVRKQLDRYADAHIAWHFVGVKSPWARRGLLASGFGSENGVVKSLFTVTNVGVSQEKDDVKPGSRDEEFSVDTQPEDKLGMTSMDTMVLPLLSIDCPYFHIDMDEAVRSVELELGLK
ncbi:hypothetical protein IWW49_000532 [Coemansia sp. RSA 1797]|nr:hypothetical protein IWW49_000532 [Coemansia sp. RSA 1797]